MTQKSFYVAELEDDNARLRDQLSTLEFQLNERDESRLKSDRRIMAAIIFTSLLDENDDPLERAIEVTDRMLEKLSK